MKTLEDSLAAEALLDLRPSRGPRLPMTRLRMPAAALGAWASGLPRAGWRRSASAASPSAGSCSSPAAPRRAASPPYSTAWWA